ncbi:MAG: L-serine ammonia-lyase, iron-sulfur-dependent, subunit alpha [Lachnospiraceae bacterium]|nr:L-serine ammonia-lyase, iron-sulfur-dependent, subunit alpha [Lachnospiraceae bacterium]
MDFKNGAELLSLCETRGLPISRIMKEREIHLAETTTEEMDRKMKRVLEIMTRSAKDPISRPRASMGGLIGGEAALVDRHRREGNAICGSLLSRAIAYSMAVLEVNSSMGLIVAAPTAGSSGVVPGVLLALKEEYHLDDADLLPALYNASAVGYLAMRNATVAGAVGGCQAEVGVASAMAASAAVELMGGTPAQCLDAASTSLMNLLGLVCDPVGGLVEYPCQNRNAIGVAGAITAAELALSGVKQLIPFDEMLAAMYNVGRRLAPELRETAKGGCAVTPAGCAAAGNCHGCR